MVAVVAVADARQNTHLAAAAAHILHLAEPGFLGLYQGGHFFVFVSGLDYDGMEGDLP